MTNTEETNREKAYAHFVDPGGRLLLKDCCVLFWDLLGSSDMSNSAGAEDKLNALHASLARARDRADTEYTGFARCSAWFTDNVVLATPMIESQVLEQAISHTLIDVAYMQIILLGDGFLARGGVAFGPHYMDDKFVFGPALVEAHQLEDEPEGERRWPCVEVSEVVAELFRLMSRKYHAEPKQSVFASELVVDEWGKVFVDQLGIWIDEEDSWGVLNHWLLQYKSVIGANLKTLPSDSRQWDKWKWLADYHNHTLREKGLNRREYMIGRGHKFTFIPFRDTI